MKRINNLPIPFDFERVTCPKCERFSAMLIKSGPKAGMVECMSSDHIKPCKYFGDEKGAEKKERRKNPKPFIKWLSDIMDSQADIKQEFKQRVLTAMKDLENEPIFGETEERDI